MSIPGEWPSTRADTRGVARFSARCDCGANNWMACDFGNGIGWSCIACGGEDADHPRVCLPERDRTEEDL